MQATVPTRRFDARQIKQAALAIALLTSTAIGVATATIVRDAGGADNSRAAIVTSSATNHGPAFDYRFLEHNLDLPTGGAVTSVRFDANYRFLEQNLYLPEIEIAPAVMSRDDALFLEQNLSLLEATSPSVHMGQGQGEGWVGAGRPRETGMNQAPGEGFVGIRGW